jgi:hypothetical protein
MAGAGDAIPRFREAETFIAEHPRIFDAMRACRTRFTVELMHGHLMDSRSRTIKRVEDLRSTGPQSRLSYLRPVGDWLWESYGLQAAPTRSEPRYLPDQGAVGRVPTP